MREAYPLDWPESEPRTLRHQRKYAPFKVTLARARDELFDELRLLGARGVVLSTNMELRRDGLPYAKQRRLDDPGAAAYWEIDGQAFAMACDTYETLRGNVRALGLSVKALRALERYASRSIRDRAFQGFAALPANAGADGERPWRIVLGYADADRPDNRHIWSRFRVLVRGAHPDQGGSQEAMRELNRAKQQALQAMS